MVSSAPVTSYAVERATLRNGLRVVLAPDRSAPVVAVAVYYDVGIRSEPEGRTGFAHLFEHLMFQGSASLEKMEHVRLRAGLRRHVQRLDPPGLHELLRGAAVERPGAGPVPRGRPDARARRHRGEPRQPDRGGEGGDPGQRPQPALRRLPVADPAAGAVRDVPQRPRRLRRLRGPGERHRRRRPRLLRPLLRARQRRARGRRRPRPGRGHGAGRTPLRRRPPAYRPRPPRLRRAGADLGAARGARRPAGAGAGGRARLAGARPRRPRRLPAVRRAGLRAGHRRRLPAAPPARAGGPGRQRRRRPRRLHGGRVRRARPDGPARRGAPPGRACPPTGWSPPSTRSSTGSRPTASPTTSWSGCGPG